MNNIHFPTSDELTWQFEKGEPYYSFANQFGGHHYEYVDPFPCYSHDRALVEDLTHEAISLFPIADAALDIFVLPNEGVSRTNGWHMANNTYKYSEPGIDKTDWPNWHSFICLNGKRTPIMNAMTRQLVCHEYGHMVEHSFQQKKGLSREEFLREYAKVRGIEYYSRYGAGHWHKQTGEIFANDFRVIICNREPDHWPHDVAHPKKNKKIQKWWKANAIV